MQKVLPFLIIGLLVSALVFASYSAGIFSGLEIFFEDLLFFPKDFSDDIVIVAIDSDSLQSVGQWPWSRAVFARFLEALKKYPPRALGIDIMFSEKSRWGEDDDLQLSQTLDEINFPVVLPVESTGDDRALLKPLSQFTDYANVALGHVNVIVDKDSIVRRLPYTAQDFKSFSYEVLHHGDVTLPNFEKEKNEIRIVYAVSAGQIKTIPFSRIIDPTDAIVKSLANKIVLLGVTVPDLHDTALTPWSRGTLMSGIDIQANIANMFLKGYTLEPVNAFVMLAVILFNSLFAALVFIIFKRIFLAFISIVLIFCVSLIFVILLFDAGIIVNFLHINFAWVFAGIGSFSYRYFASDVEKKRMRNLFSKYVSPRVLEHILENPHQVRLGGEVREITILFSDIRSFTTLSEKTSPQELVNILNTYFTAMTEAILDNNGVLDKYIGDAIMAFWGAPLPDEHQADNALKAAQAMLEKLKILNREFQLQGRPEIKIGIGIYTGRAVVGNVGSELRFDYTVIGDTVNVASRLEGLNKEYGTQIIVGENTKEKIKHDYPFRFLGNASVKGRQEPIKIYTIVEEGWQSGLMRRT